MTKMIKGSFKINLDEQSDDVCKAMNKSMFSGDNSSSSEFFRTVIPDSFTYKYYQTGRTVSLQFSSKSFFSVISQLLKFSFPLPPSGFMI